jgi:hypothetical protein
LHTFCTEAPTILYTADLSVCRTLADLRLLLQVPDPLEMANNERIDWNLLEKLLKTLKASDVVSDKYGVKRVCIVAHHFVSKRFNFFYRPSRSLGFDM